MKRTVTRQWTWWIGCLILSLWVAIPQSAGQTHRCGQESFQHYFGPQNQLVLEQQDLIIRNWLAQQPAETFLETRSPIVIPVVIHVVYRLDEENISDEQIFSQLDVLNSDYRALNESLSIIPESFQDVIADMEVEFCLAQRTPDEEATTGILRVPTEVEAIGSLPDVHYREDGGSDAWEPEQYLNIWIADMGGDFAGRANFPGQGPAAEDGAVIDPRFFGTVGTAQASFPYNLGRTTTHEIGHYFNLRHVWGSGGAACGKDDGLADTPETGNTFLGQCPNQEFASCGSSDMYTNYMYYTDDACMAQFTLDQKAWMLATLNTLRPGLLNSPGCLPPGVDHPNQFGPLSVSVFPSPARDFILLETTTGNEQDLEVDLYSMDGRRLFSRKYSPNIRHRIELSSLPAGVYVLHIRQGEVQFQEKFVVGRYE
ncbi:MAG: zinc-dependent metalloprotease [Bacteroidota bacterium]